MNDDAWRIPDEKASMYVLLNKKSLRINMLTIFLDEINSHSKETAVV